MVRESTANAERAVSDESTEERERAVRVNEMMEAYYRECEQTEQDAKAAT